MSGLEVCRKIKEDPHTAHIPIMQVSATFVDAESRVRGLQGGADAYLAAPVTREELIATVAALLRMKDAERAARVKAEEAEQARLQLAELNSTLEKRVRERTAELEDANQNLRELSHRLLAMQDEEHKKIARELHDVVGQLLAGICMNLSVVSREAGRLSPNAQKAMSDNAEMVQEIIRNVRSMSHLLHPPLLDESGLRSALSWYVDEFGRRSGVKVNFECSPELGRLPSDMEIALFRIVQESLGNVLRHSQSPTAFISLDTSRDEILLSVKDEGVGMSSDRERQIQMGDRQGVGVRGMRERVRQLNGSFKVRSGARGTEISVALPHPAQGQTSRDAVA
jgi:signal transduction histidine kinase